MYSPASALRGAYGYGYGQPMVLVGADDQPSMWQKTKDFLGAENATIGHGVKNGYIVAGAALAGLYFAGYLGGRKHGRR